MQCTKTREESPFFADGRHGAKAERAEAKACACSAEIQESLDRATDWRELALTAIALLLGGMAGAATDGGLGFLVGAFLGGCVGAIAGMTWASRERGRAKVWVAPAGAAHEGAREVLRAALERAQVPQSAGTVLPAGVAGEQQTMVAEIVG